MVKGLWSMVKVKGQTILECEWLDTAYEEFLDDP